MLQPFTEIEREEILTVYRTALTRYHEAMELSNSYKPWSKEEFEALHQAESHLKDALHAEKEYFERLPRLSMSCCPFDGKPLIRSFDPYGLDGLWWRSDASPEEIPSCPHFCVLHGALSFEDHEPRAGDFEVHPGPQVPYVIPRLLAYPEMIAVISQIRMKNGYIAYPIAYFAKRRPPQQELTAGWVRTNYVYTTQLGEHGWRIPNDLWDFDLRPWLQQGKIRWCPPGSDNAVLSTDSPEQCPYLDLLGERQRQVVQGNRVWARGFPDGKPVFPSIC